MINQVVQFIPEYMSWDDWNGNVLHYFSEEPMPVVSEENWQELANALSSYATFNNYAVPNPYTYENWQLWARDFIESVNGPTQ